MRPPKKQKHFAAGRPLPNAPSNQRPSFDIEQALATAIKNHQSGNLQQAEKIYEEILAINPNHAETLHAQAIMACQRGQHAVAVTLFQRAIHEDPAKAKYYYNLGNALKDLGQFDQAVPCYGQALLLKPDYIEALNNLGTALHNQGKFDEAIASYQEALRINPDHAESLYNLAVTLQSMNRLKDAVLCYQKALAAKEDFPEVYNRLGIIFHEQGKLDAAISCFQQALRINPTVADFHFGLATTLKDQGHLNEAIAGYQKAIELAPEFALAYGNLGSAFKQIGNLDGAIVSCRKALRIDPDIPEVYMLLATLLFITRDWEQFDKLVDASLSNQHLYEQNRNWLYLQTALQAWMIGNLARCTEYLDAAASIQYLKPEDIYEKSRLAFYCLLKKLTDYRTNSPHLYSAENSLPAYMLGDSHCLSFANLPVRIDENPFTIVARLVMGCKAYHLSQKRHNQYKEELLRNIADIPDGSTAILSFGEIDCRTDEGIYSAWIKKFQHLSVEKMVRDVVEGYLEFVSEVTKGRKFRLMLLGVPAPTRSTVSGLTAEEIPTYVSIPRLWNEYLQRATLQKGWTFLDNYSLTCDDQGFSHGRYHIDDHHLYPAALALLVAEHAITPHFSP